MYRLLRQKADGLGDACLSFAQKLVQTPSPSFEEADVATLIEEELKRLRYDTVVRDDFGNVVGILHGRETEPTVLLTSHMDTVPHGSGDWRHPPHAGVIDGGRLYGVGAGDCKGGLAAMIYAGAALKRSLLPLRGTLVVAATVAEEQGGSVGVRHLIEHTLPEFALSPTSAILAEPTSLGLYYGHDGWLEIEIVVEGEEPTHVTGAAWAIFDNMELLGQDVRSHHALELVPARPPSFAEAGGGRRATIRMDRRVRHPEGIDAALVQVKHHAALVTRPIGAVQVGVAVREEERRLYTGRSTTVRRVTHAWATDPFHPLVEGARQALGAAGLTVRPGTWKLGRLGMGTAGSLLAGEFGIPTIGYGPGDEDVVHSADEWVAADNVREAVYGTASIVHQLAGVPVLGWASDEGGSA